MSEKSQPSWHGTTILSVRKGNEGVVAGDGQVSLGRSRLPVPPPSGTS